MCYNKIKKPKGRIGDGIMRTEISQNVAYAILRARGWDEIGATEIIISMVEDKEEFTVENVTKIAMDYEDR